MCLNQWDISQRVGWVWVQVTSQKCWRVRMSETSACMYDECGLWVWLTRHKGWCIWNTDTSEGMMCMAWCYEQHVTRVQGPVRRYGIKHWLCQSCRFLTSICRYCVKYQRVWNDGLCGDYPKRATCSKAIRVRYIRHWKLFALCRTIMILYQTYIGIPKGQFINNNNQLLIEF